MPQYQLMNPSLLRMGLFLLVSAFYFHCDLLCAQVLPADSSPINRNSWVVPPAPQIAYSRTQYSDYWVVSARHCKDQLEVGLPCDYAVTRYQGAQCRPSSLGELNASIAPNIPVCIMVHGSFVQYDSMLLDSAGTYRWIRNAAPDRPLQMIFYSWPSDDPNKLVPNLIDVHGARILGRRAELSSEYLVDLISQIPDSTPVCLMGHSHGTRTISAALHLMGGGAIEGRSMLHRPQRPKRIRTVLAAAAMDHDWFNPGERYDRALAQTEALVNLLNRHDIPLVFHPTHELFASNALGLTGFTNGDQRRLGLGMCRVTDCDVTSIVKCRHFWPYYYREPSIATAIRHFVYFDE